MLRRVNCFAKSLQSYVGYSSGGKCASEIANLKSELSLFSEGSYKQAESAVRKLGEVLGYTSTRPDNDQGTGPDVLWVDEENKNVIGFELKTEKEDSAKYHKKDIGQGHDHITWIKDQYSEYELLGLLYVGPYGCVDKSANPSREMGLCPVEQMKNFSDSLIALIDDLMKIPPIERPQRIASEATNEKWTMKYMVNQLWAHSMVDLCSG